MHEIHPRHSVRFRGAHLLSVPVLQTTALDRRHSLDAQQRLYRESLGTGTGTRPHEAGHPRKPA
jgi:hypothetical protein